MCSRYGKCSKYVEHTSYMLITCMVLLISSLGFFLRMGMVLFDAGLNAAALPQLWPLLAGASITGLLGVLFAFATVKRL
ncbi:hypothetical protein [Xanthomonas phage RTH11]|nr:hypothetical protein [Xanthomonas phage RTH11]